MTTVVSTVTLPDGLTLSYVEQGDQSGPALVLLPGPTGSWRSYEPILEAIPRSVRTIAVSQRGHGDSDTPHTGYRVQDFAGDVVPLLDALHVDRAVLAGHSGSCLAGAELIVYSGIGHTRARRRPALRLRHRRLHRAIEPCLSD